MFLPILATEARGRNSLGTKGVRISIKTAASKAKAVEVVWWVMEIEKAGKAETERQRERE